MNLSQEIIDKKFSLPKTTNKIAVPEKQSVVYTTKQQTKLNLKR